MRTLVHCQYEWELEQSLWKILWIFLKKLKIELVYENMITMSYVYVQTLQDKWDYYVSQAYTNKKNKQK